MELSIIVKILSILFSGGIGALLMQLYTAKVNKKKLAAEAEEAAASASRKKQDNRQDAFETMYQQLNKCIADYTAISEEYRKHREKMRKYEEAVQAQIHDKCVELAAMKAKITYLKGIRCYNTLCPNRIRENPDKKVAESFNQEIVQETEKLEEESVQTE